MLRQTRVEMSNQEKGRSMICEEIIKQPSEKFNFGFDFREVLSQGEYITEGTLSALKISVAPHLSLPGFVGSLAAYIPGGTADTLGESDEIIATTINHAEIGISSKDMVVNHTKGWTTPVKRFANHTNANDTLVVARQNEPTEVGDEYSAPVAIATLEKNVAQIADGDRVKVTLRIVTSHGKEFETDLIVNIKDF